VWRLLRPGEWVPGSIPDNPPWPVHQGFARVTAKRLIQVIR